MSSRRPYRSAESSSPAAASLGAGQRGRAAGQQIPEIAGHRRIEIVGHRIGQADLQRPGASKTAPVSSSSRAAAGAVRCSTGTEMTAGISPIRTSLNAKVAVAATTTMSAAAMMPMPPARAGPATLARTGLGQWAIRRRMAGSSRTPCRPGAAAASSLRSMPEQKTGPVWLSTTTRTASSAAAASSASISSDAGPRTGHSGWRASPA